MFALEIWLQRAPWLNPNWQFCHFSTTFNKLWIICFYTPLLNDSQKNCTKIFVFENNNRLHKVWKPSLIFNFAKQTAKKQSTENYTREKIKLYSEINNRKAFPVFFSIEDDIL